MFNDITLGQIVTAITTIGVISAFCYKIFSIFHQVKTNSEKIKTLNNRIDTIENDRKIEKNELLAKVEETNNAVNLLCSGVSALINDALEDNQTSKQELKRIKQKLEDKKEIV